jgi:AraC-like DNA-binding protein
VTGDTLSDVLRTVRLRGAVFYFVSGSEAWAAHAPPARDIAEAVFPGAEHVMEYHVVTKGSAWAAIDGQAPVRLDEGDIVVFPHGDEHVMTSAPGLRPEPSDAGWYFATRRDPKPMPVTYHGVDSFSVEEPPGDAPNNLVCGFFGCDVRPFNPLIANLPHLLHVPAGGDSLETAMLRQAMQAWRERRPGSEAMLERISEMMFVNAVRRYLESLPEESLGWLAGLRDRHVGRALSALHAEPARDWSMELLAREAALSRSALHDRFAQLVGQPPMQYLTQWRMQVAARLLRDCQSTVAAVALEVGYESEAAFARAFKRQTGKPPAAWRRESRAAADRNARGADGGAG